MVPPGAKFVGFEFFAHPCILRGGFFIRLTQTANFLAGLEYCNLQTRAMVETHQPTLTPTAMANRVGISVPYASQLLSGRRVPSRALAVRIWRGTGQKLGPLTHIEDADIEALERIENANARPEAEA